MAVKYTLDTNLLIYAADSATSSDKRRLSQHLIRSAAESRQPLALQVLHEFCHVVTRKRLMTVESLRKLVHEYAAAFDIVASHPAGLQSALHLHERSKYSYFDSLLLTTAAGAGCSVFFSEDMQDGFTVDGMQIVNPFSRTAEEIDALLQR